MEFVNERGERWALTSSLAGCRPDEQEMLLVDPEVLRLETAKRTDEEAGADQKRQR